MRCESNVGESSTLPSSDVAKSSRRFLGLRKSVDNCRKFIDLQTTLPWEISESEIQGWLEMPPKDKQRAHLQRMSGVWATKEAEKLKLDGKISERANKFEELASSRSLSPNVLRLLAVRYQSWPDGIEALLEKS